MKVVYKYKLTGLSSGEVRLDLPMGATPVAVGFQCEELQLWVDVDNELPIARREFKIAATDEELPSDASYIHLFTFFHGQYVWHLFERFPLVPTVVNQKVASPVPSCCYQTKPKFVKAKQLFPENVSEILEWIKYECHAVTNGVRFSSLQEGGFQATAVFGEWIVQNEDGEFTHFSNKKFTEKFEVCKA